MAKKQAAKMGDTVDVVRPYLERALRDEDFRKDLKDALQAARELYGPTVEVERRGQGASETARHRQEGPGATTARVRGSRTLPRRSRARRRRRAARGAR